MTGTSKMRKLVAKSSLGTPAARQLRARTPLRVAAKIVKESGSTDRSRGSGKTTPYKSS
jgi:hypothetical protein